MRKCLICECHQKGGSDPHFSTAFSFSDVFWIDASSTDTITQGLKGICNLPAAYSSELDGSPESALHWIGLLKENYIMVFDNADVLSPAELEAYLPPGRWGNILITSRNSAMMTLTSPESSLEVTEMEERDAIELLLKASCLDPSSMEFQAEASKIVNELLCLPVAIDQAGAYIASGATTIGNYLGKYFEHRKTLLSCSEFRGASKYNRSVYEIWELSYEEIQKRAESDDPHNANPAKSAMLLLNLFPFFHYEGIIEEIFSYAALPEDEKTSSSNLPHASSLLDQRLLPLNKSGTWDSFVFREGLRILLSFSLIKKGPSDGMYSMHPLVHAWGRDRLTLKEKQRCSLMAFAILSCSLKPDESQPYSFRRILVTHVRANMQYIREGHQTTLPYFNDAQEKFWKLLREQGHASEAESLISQVVDARNKSLGAEHPDTIRAMANLAKSYQDLGKYFKAEKVEIQVLNARNSIFGAEHPDTFTAMADLAETYRALSRYAEAEKLEIQVLEARKKILGGEHPDTINAIANLAETYRALNQYAEVEKLDILVLDARQRILGFEHPHTINALAKLAETYGALNKYAEAEKLGIQVLDARSRILGDEHPDTIDAMANLAKTNRALNKYAEAEKLEIQVLDARNRILGYEHPDTIDSMANLAKTYRALNKYAEAEKLGIQVLDARSRILGGEHPDTITATANLAETYKALSRYAEAEKLEIQVLNARNRILGGEHLDTINAMANLAETYRALNQYAEAEKLETQVLDARNRILGGEHLDTINAMANLAETYRSLNQYTKAEGLEIQVVDARNRILGGEHLDTVDAMANLAETYRALNLYAEAEELEIHVVDSRNRIFGAEHPDTIKSMENLAATYKAMGKYKEAEELRIKILELKNKALGEAHPDPMAAYNDATTKALQDNNNDLKIKYKSIQSQSKGTVIAQLPSPS